MNNKEDSTGEYIITVLSCFCSRILHIKSCNMNRKGKFKQKFVQGELDSAKGFTVYLLRTAIQLLLIK